MAGTILPSGEEVKVTPAAVLRYLNIDGLRQTMRQERLRWHLKANKDVDYSDNNYLYKYYGELHNNGSYQRMEIRTFPDNGAREGYAGLHIDSGVYGMEHNVERWDEAMTPASTANIVNRMQMGAMATIPGKEGYGMDSFGNMVENTENRMAMFVCDPFDGRIYALSNDPPIYTNNETAANKRPERTVARLCDIPTRITQLANDMGSVTDPDYHHTDNNFTHSNRFVLDNLDDRTFVYPEISKDSEGNYITNLRMGLNGEHWYDEADGTDNHNTQPDLGLDPNVSEEGGDRGSDAACSIGANQKFNGVDHLNGFIPGVFRSLEELEKVDLVGQLQLPLDQNHTPGSMRPINYYSFDGIWTSTWFASSSVPASYKGRPLNPSNMEYATTEQEPKPYSQGSDYTRSNLYQWRYNRVETKYPVANVRITIVEQGQGYAENDMLRWNFGNDSFVYKVTSVSSSGQIQAGEFVPDESNVYDQDPSTHGVGIEFYNPTSAGYGCKLAIECTPVHEVYTTQLKNNLYAYVDVIPTVRSDNSSPWSDVNTTDTQGGKVGIRSTAAGPAYSGINSGKGCAESRTDTDSSILFEHGGNATAGVSVHLFRYVLNTQNPTWVIKDGVQVFTGRWVDQGPLGVERPCDIKALLLSNPDTNNFNNYYKFMFDILVDLLRRNPDAIDSNNPNAVSLMYKHVDQVDPAPDRRFTRWTINPETSMIEEVDITDKVTYINAATGIEWHYSNVSHNDPEYGYGHRSAGWFAVAGAISK